jgi:hypothetical protein
MVARGKKGTGTFIARGKRGQARGKTGEKGTGIFIEGVVAGKRHRKKGTGIFIEGHGKKGGREKGDRHLYCAKKEKGDKKRKAQEKKEKRGQASLLKDTGKRGQAKSRKQRCLSPFFSPLFLILGLPSGCAP